MYIYKLFTISIFFKIKFESLITIIDNFFISIKRLSYLQNLYNFNILF